MKSVKCFARTMAAAAVMLGVAFAATTSAHAAPVATYAAVTVKVADGQAECGKVSGGKSAKVGAVLTLTATPNKGWGFAGWYREGDSALASGTDGVPVSYASSWKYTVEDREDQTFVAKFVSEKDDSLQIVDRKQDGVYEFGLDATPDVTVELDGKPGEYSVPTTLSVSGLPTGIKYVKPGPESIFGTFTGKATKAGVYYVQFKAQNKNGYKYFYMQKWVVGGADPNGSDYDEIGIDWDSKWLRPLKEFQVGKACSVSLKPELSKLGVTKLDVKGLPNGVKFLGMDDSSWSIEGYPTTPAPRLVLFTATMADGSTKKALKTFIVRDSGYRYVSIVPAKAYEALGTTVKSGVYQVGKQKIALTAKPARKDIFFGGWYFSEDAAQGDGDDALQGTINDGTGIDDLYTDSGDWRKASDKMMFYWDIAEGKKRVDIYAKFITADQDELAFYTDRIRDEPLGSEYTFFAGPPDEEYDDFSYFVWSWTYPTVTAKNLPPGVALDTKYGCLRATRSKVKPGMVYTNVTLTAKNQTGMTKTVNLTLRIANQRSDLVPQANYDVENGYSLMVGQDVSASDLTLWLNNNDFGTGWNVSATGLPTGMSLDGILTDDTGSEMINLGHAPTKAGTYAPVFTLTRGTGKDKETESFSVTINVYDMPAALTGLFNGLTCFATPNANDPYADVRPESRIVTISAKKDGTISAKAGKQSFSRNLGHCWQPNEDGSWCYDVYTPAAKENGNYVAYKLHIDATAEEKEIGAYGFTGFIAKLTQDAAGNEISSEFVEDGVFYTYQNILNTDERVAPFVAELAKQTTKTIGFTVEEKKDNLPEWARDAYSLKYTADLKAAAVKVKVTTKGVVNVSGKVDGVAIKASTTLYPVYDEDEKSMTFYGWIPTTFGHRTALVWINLGFWPDEKGAYSLSELMGSVFVR